MKKIEVIKFGDWKKRIVKDDGKEYEEIYREADIGDGVKIVERVGYGVWKDLKKIDEMTPEELCKKMRWDTFPKDIGLYFPHTISLFRDGGEIYRLEADLNDNFYLRHFINTVNKLNFKKKVEIDIEDERLLECLPENTTSPDGHFSHKVRLFSDLATELEKAVKVATGKVPLFESIDEKEVWKGVYRFYPDAKRVWSRVKRILIPYPTESIKEEDISFYKEIIDEMVALIKHQIKYCPSFSNCIDGGLGFVERILEFRLKLKNAGLFPELVKYIDERMHEVVEYEKKMIAGAKKKVGEDKWDRLKKFIKSDVNLYNHLKSRFETKDINFHDYEMRVYPRVIIREGDETVKKSFDWEHRNKEMTIEECIKEAEGKITTRKERYLWQSMDFLERITNGAILVITLPVEKDRFDEIAEHLDKIPDYRAVCEDKYCEVDAVLVRKDIVPVFNELMDVFTFGDKYFDYIREYMEHNGNKVKMVKDLAKIKKKCKKISHGKVAGREIILVTLPDDTGELYLKDGDVWKIVDFDDIKKWFAEKYAEMKGVKWWKLQNINTITCQIAYYIIANKTDLLNGEKGGKSQVRNNEVM